MRSQHLLSTVAYDRLVGEAAEAVRRLAGDTPCPLVIIAGSGLTGLVEALSVERRIAPQAVPHLPSPSVPGHHGGIFLGRLGSLGTILFAGRVHLYEGWSAQESVLSVHLAARLGARILLATNATGGVSEHLWPGDLVLLTDQINLTFRYLPTDPTQREHRADSPLYDAYLSERMREAARLEKISLKEGVYAGTLGPAYETKAESAMLAQIGADVVGMSTIAELLAARLVGLRAMGISCIANQVPKWGRGHIVTHADVLGRVGSAVERLKRLLVRWAEMVADDAGR